MILTKKSAALHFPSWNLCDIGGIHSRQHDSGICCDGGDEAYSAAWVPYVHNGIIMEKWTSAIDGAFQLTPILESLTRATRT